MAAQQGDEVGVVELDGAVEAAQPMPELREIPSHRWAVAWLWSIHRHCGHARIVNRFVKSGLRQPALRNLDLGYGEQLQEVASRPALRNLNRGCGHPQVAALWPTSGPMMAVFPLRSGLGCPQVLRSPRTLWPGDQRRFKRLCMADSSSKWPPPQEEIEVLRLHMQGLSDRAIARRLSISAATVRRRAARVRDRCGARTRAEATALLVAHGLLKVTEEEES